MFDSVLIANRGEIAVRIAKTLRSMGIRSVVTASIPDRRSLAVRTADDWVLLEGYSAAESYLDVDAVIAAAKEKGCQAIHPGYGFLSERADFAERCAAEGVVFIGPPPDVLRGLGDKASARKLATENGVPVVPGWDGEDDDATLTGEAARIGFPVMLKARGGGGGRGMREVFSAEELRDAIESARREALAAFGDGGLLLEKLVTNAHHVEVQVLADTHGNVIHLRERDCSVQRRHQKLIEETPSPVVDDALRERLTGYALKLARAIGYVNAGTFEFLVVPADRPSPSEASSLPTPASRERGETSNEAEVYFLEVNPRLQVEHPVTEMVTGLDLVELQLRIAADEPLPLAQEDVKFSGHAIEFRINAEDPWDGFKPSSGRLGELGFPPSGIYRIETGYDDGDEVPAHYDSLLAKLVVEGNDRSDALATALREISYHRVTGLRTNLALLTSIVASNVFEEGSADVGWLERSFNAVAEAAMAPVEYLAAAAIAVAGLQDDPGTPFRAAPAPFYLDDGVLPRLVHPVIHSDRHAIVAVDDATVRCDVVRKLKDHIWVAVPQRPVAIAVFKSGSHLSTWLDDDLDTRTWRLFVVPPPALPRRAHTAAEGATAITAPLAGTIAAVRVAEGDEVVEGQLLVVLEAMKMEHRIVAPAAGVVKALLVRERDVVREGDILAELG